MIERNIFAAAAILLLGACQADETVGNMSQSTDTATNWLLDRQSPRNGVATPVAEGAGGLLGYADSCPFITEDSGVRIGLVVPHEARFDGRQLEGSLSTPDGEAIVHRIGERASFSGRLIDNAGDGYRCRTDRLLLVDAL